MTNKVAELIYGKNLGSNSYETGRVGVEIETEAKKGYEVPAYMSDYWIAHADGSLRDFGMEYVFARPYDIGSEQYEGAFEAFNRLTKNIKFQKSVYSSVHVHFNMLDLNAVQMANFMALYFLFEEVLTTYCGPDRNGNLFCLKTSNAEFNINTACQLVEDLADGYAHEAIRRLNVNNLKYSALNLASLRNRGSLEIRTFPGVTDSSEIKLWVNILNCLYERAVKFENPMVILRMVEKSSHIRYFLRYVFGDYSQYLNEEVFIETVRNPLWYMSKFATCVDWNLVLNWKEQYEKRISEVKSPKKKKFPGQPVSIGLDDFTVDEVATTGTGNTIGNWQAIYNDLTSFATAPNTGTVVVPTEEE